MSETPQETIPSNSPGSSRTQHSTRNALVGVLCQMAGMLLSFVVSLVFARTLNKEYAGISGWFANILQVLNISELGISTAIVVSLYQPLATGDKPRIRASLRMLRKAYRMIGLAVLVLGLGLLPFLPLLLNKQTDLVDLRMIYLLFLGQSVFSYLFSGYKAAIFTADQRQSRIHVITFCTTLLTSALQIFSLVALKSYYAYVAVFVLQSIVKNLLIARSANREYPYLKDVACLQPGEDDEAALPKEKRRGIFKNLFGLSLYRVSGTVLNATDNLVLGAFIGVGIIGIYSRYLFAITAVSTILTLLFQSFTASVGNLNVTGNPERRHFIFRCLNLLDGWLYGFAAVCLYVLLDPFVALFYGQDWLFTDARVVPVIVLNFLTSGLLENVIMHKDACGLFWQGRFRPLFSAGLNIVLSLWWVTPLGIFGVLLATVVSRLLTTWWFDPWMVHHYALKAGVRGYALQTGLVFLLAAGCCVGVKALCGALFSGVTAGSFFLSMLICLFLPNVVFFLVFGRTEEFAYLKGQALRLAAKIKRRIR